MKDLLSQNIGHAKAFKLSAIMDLTSDEHEVFDQRFDVKKNELFWEMPLPEDREAVRSEVHAQMENLVASLHLPSLLPLVRRWAEEVAWGVEQRPDITHMYQMPQEQEVAVTLDKNAKQLAFASKRGYWRRLAAGYLNDSNYRLCGKETAESLRSRKQSLFARFIPPRWSKPSLELTERHIQYAYHNYKKKCHHPAGGLACGKSHTHDRETCSDFHNPHK